MAEPEAGIGASSSGMNDQACVKLAKLGGHVGSGTPSTLRLGGLVSGESRSAGCWSD